jgi:hypothetical protein
MTERQRALAAYVRTLGPHVRRARSVNEFVDLLMGAIREDGVFLAAQFAQGLLVQGKRKVDQAAPPAVTSVTDVLASAAATWLKNLTEPKRRR